MRGESEASAVVLETKRMFVRFISHEVRTPLNAVHLGLEARTFLEMFRRSPLHINADHLWRLLDATWLSWLELSAEMMSNSSAAEDVLDDLLNYDKIEMRILVLKRVLTLKGYVCEQAEDGQEAIDVYRASLASGLSFDAITVDFEMPVMNGPTATGHLRAMGCTVPIIGVTGNMLSDDITLFKSQGATEVMGKPLNLSRFQELV